MSKKKIDEKEIEDTTVEIGSGSVYADLGFKNHEEMQTKADLVIEISKAIKKKKLTQIQVAEILGISQPKVSELLNGHFRGCSVERLMLFLNKLGKDVDIIVKSKPRHRAARVSVCHSDDRCSNEPMVAKGR
ncbi:MAG: helix-turn-helix transcriptional regulator [Chlamydiota bacterium]